MKTYLFHSPKTAGNTIVCLNMALAYQMKNPHQRVGLISATRYPDINQYLGLKADQQSLHQLLRFIGTPEWSPSLVKTIAQTQVIQVVPAPVGPQWSDFDLKKWQAIYGLVGENFDVLFLDLGRDIPAEIQNDCLAKADIIVTTSCLDPISLTALQQFLAEHKAHQAKQYLLINQAPKEGRALIEKNLKNHSAQVIGTLPLEQKHMWDQVYKHFPLMLQKKSPWKKALSLSLEKLQNL